MVVGSDQASDARSLEDSMFQKRGARATAESPKPSAESSKKRQGTPLQSSKSIVNFYIIRAGTNLGTSRPPLKNARQELRKLFDKEAQVQVNGRLPKAAFCHLFPWQREPVLNLPREQGSSFGSMT